MPKKQPPGPPLKADIDNDKWDDVILPEGDETDEIIRGGKAMITILSILYFAALYSIKGGWLGKIPGWNEFVKSHPALDWALDGTRLSILGAFLICLPFVSVLQALLFAAAWAYCASSMGEEAGAVGDYKEGWGSYVALPAFGRMYGVKKALQWGLAWGALMALVTGCGWFIVAASTFPIVYFTGSSLYRYFKNDRGWAWAEPLYGALIGTAVSIWINGII